MASTSPIIKQYPTVHPTYDNPNAVKKIKMYYVLFPGQFLIASIAGENQKDLESRWLSDIPSSLILTDGL